MTERDISPPEGKIYEQLLLQRILSELTIIRKEQITQGKDIAGLKVKAGLWGTIGGALVTGVYVIVGWIRGFASG